MDPQADDDGRISSINPNDDTLTPLLSSFTTNDPLGLIELNESHLPTYSYSLGDGLHNFVIPVSVSQYVVSGQSFGVAPVIKPEPGMNVLTFTFLYISHFVL